VAVSGRRTTSKITVVGQIHLGKDRSAGSAELKSSSSSRGGKADEPLHVTAIIAKCSRVDGQTFPDAHSPRTGKIGPQAGVARKCVQVQLSAFGRANGAVGCSCSGFLAPSRLRR